MGKVEYSPKSLEDLHRVKKYIVENYGDEVGKKVLLKITTNIRQLEKFPASGVVLAGIVDVPTDYLYLFIAKNYIFYRIEGEAVLIIRVLNEQQDYVQILFGISSSSENEEDD